MTRILTFLLSIGALLDQYLFAYFVRAGFVLPVSLISQLPAAFRNVANGSGGAAINNGQIRLELNKDFLTSEHVVNVGVSQNFTGVPTSCDVRRFFTKIELITNEGTIYTSDGGVLYDIMRFTELSSAPINVLAATSTSQFSMNLHHAMDNSHADLLTALQTANFSTLSLVLTVAPDANNGFIGGTVPVAALYTVAVDALQLADPSFSGRDAASRNKIVYGKARHWFKAMAEKSAAVSAASSQEVLLDTGNRTRFIILHSYNTTSGVNVLADGIIDTVNLNVNSVDYIANRKAINQRQRNIADRGFNQVGVHVFDFGDDPKAWIPLEHVNTAKLLYSTLGTAPAGWLVRTAQDYATGYEALGV